MTYQLSMCQHCRDAPCLEACSSRAEHLPQRRRHRAHRSGQVPGQQDVHSGCPYENTIFYNDSLNIAQKCTFCSHLADKGWTDTRCADACPTGALIFGEEEDFKHLIAKAEPLKPGLSHRASPMGVSSEIGSCAIFKTLRTFATGISMRRAISSLEGSRPSSWTN